jgi:hypothetical protein
MATGLIGICGAIERAGLRQICIGVGVLRCLRVHVQCERQSYGPGWRSSSITYGDGGLQIDSFDRCVRRRPYDSVTRGGEAHGGLERPNQGSWAWPM